MFKCLATQTRVRPSHDVTLSGTRRKHGWMYERHRFLPTKEYESCSDNVPVPAPEFLKRTEIHFWRSMIASNLISLVFGTCSDRVKNPPDCGENQHGSDSKSLSQNNLTGLMNKAGIRLRGSMNALSRDAYCQDINIFSSSEEASHFPLREILSEKELLQCLSLKSRRKKHIIQHIKGSAAEFVKCNIKFCFYVLSSCIFDNLAHFNNSQRCTSSSYNSEIITTNSTTVSLQRSCLRKKTYTATCTQCKSTHCGETFIHWPGFMQHFNRVVTN